MIEGFSHLKLLHLPLAFVSRTPSSKLKAPAKHKAEYSPNDKPIAQVALELKDWNMHYNTIEREDMNDSK